MLNKQLINRLLAMVDVNAPNEEMWLVNNGTSLKVKVCKNDTAIYIQFRSFSNRVVIGYDSSIELLYSSFPTLLKMLESKDTEIK